MINDKISGTFLVLGTYSTSYKDRDIVGIHKYVQCINKEGKIATFDFNIYRASYEEAYIERGDIIKIENGCLVKNLTTEKLKSKFVKTR